MEHNLYLLAVALHIIAVVLWLGSASFLAFAALPFFKKRAPEQLLNFFEFCGKRLVGIGYTVFAILILTGTYSLHYRFGLSSLMQKEFWLEGSGLLLFCKLLLFCTIILLSLWHDFFMGPKTLSVWRKVNAGERQNTKLLKKLRRHSALVGRLIGLLALGIIFLAVKIVRG